MYFKNEVTDELNEISANFDPLLNLDILKIISLREPLLTNRRRNNVGLLCVDYGDNLVELNEFEQALIRKNILFLQLIIQEPVNFYNRFLVTLSEYHKQQ